MSCPTSYCPLVENYIGNVSSARPILSLNLPKTFDEYIFNIADKNVRTEWRRARDAGYALERCPVVSEKTGKLLIGLFKSWDKKQGRSINLEYSDLNLSNLDTSSGWPVKEYGKWCDKHTLEMYFVKKEDELAGFIELLVSGNSVFVHSTMTGRKYQSDHVSKFMFVEVIKRTIMDGKRVFHYGDTGFLLDDRVHFVKQLGITKPSTYSTNMVNGDNQIVVLDLDDLEIGRGGLEELLGVKEHIPNLKVNLFMVTIPNQLITRKISIDDYMEWADWLREQDWIELCPHGMTHAQSEFKYLASGRKMVDYDTANIYIDAVEEAFKKVDLPYKKIWKSPYWESSPQVIKAVWDRGYVLCVDPNQDIPRGGPVYEYNWSIDKPFPRKLRIVKGHGHMHLPDKNALGMCLKNVLSIPENVEYRFISEVML